MSAGRAAGALAALACAACAGAPAGPAVDLTPFSWSWTQVAFGATVIRYGVPAEKETDAAPEAEPPALPASAGASQTRFASYRYGCARADGEPGATCTVVLDFSLLELDPPLADLAPDAWRARLAGPAAGAGELVRDSHGRTWCHRALALAGGGVFSQYSRPIDAGRALAVSSFTTRAPGRVAARDLAREAIDRTVVAGAQE